MRYHLKKLSSSIALACAFTLGAGTNAFAEIKTSGTKQSTIRFNQWVGIHKEDGCLIGVAAGKRILQVVNSNGTIWLTFQLDKPLPGEKHIIGVSVDDREVYPFLAQTNGQQLLLALPTDPNSPSVRLISDIIDGSQLYLRDSLHFEISKFPLSGSGKAIQFLSNCGKGDG